MNRYREMERRQQEEYNEFAGNIAFMPSTKNSLRKAWQSLVWIRRPTATG